MTDGGLVLVTCVGADRELGLLPHFIRHYMELGVPASAFRVMLNADRADSRGLARALDILESHGIEPAATWIGPYTSGEMWRRRRELQESVAGADDWVLSADVDELHEYPAPLEAFLADCDGSGVDAVQGVLIDRLAPDGELAPVPADGSIWERFPVEADVMGAIGGVGRFHGRGGTVKLMAFRGRHLPSLGGHSVLHRADAPRPRFWLGTDIGRLPNILNPRLRFSIPLRVHHFKWTADLVASVATRLETPGASPAGSEYGRKVLNYALEHGRIRPGDVVLADGVDAATDGAWKRQILIGRALRVPGALIRRAGRLWPAGRGGGYRG